MDFTEEYLEMIVDSALWREDSPGVYLGGVVINNELHMLRLGKRTESSESESYSEHFNLEFGNGRPLKAMDECLVETVYDTGTCAEMFNKTPCSARMIERLHYRARLKYEDRQSRCL